jgi:hypothetical protein
VPAAPPPPPPEPEPEPALPDVSVDTDSADPSFDFPEAPPFERPSWSEPPAPEPEPAPLEDLAGAVEPEPAMPDVDLDLDEPPLSPEEMVGESVEPEASPLDQLTEPEASPFGDELLDAPPDAEEPAPPSWDAIVETCKGLAQANGAMLVDPAGGIRRAGDWRPPG